MKEVAGSPETLANFGPTVLRYIAQVTYINSCYILIFIRLSGVKINLNYSETVRTAQ